MPRVRIVYRDDLQKDADELNPSAYAQIAAKRRYGIDAVKANDPETNLFACWVEIVGAQEAKAAGDEGFDAWLETVLDMELPQANGDGENPTPAETSTASSGDSPPILE